MDMNGHIEKEGQEKEAGSGQEMGGKTQGAADSDGEDMQVGEDKAVENGQRAITPQERQRPVPRGPHDPAYERAVREQLKCFKQPVALQPYLAVPFGEESTVEKEGYAEGAIFVLSLDNVPDWAQAIIQPPQCNKRSRAGQRQDPFSSATLKAQYKGYGRWKAHVQWGVFAIVCLRCHAEDAKSTDKRNAIKEALHDPRFNARVRAALVGRQRQPNVAVELPIVVCAQLEATEDVQRQLLDMLKHITGTSKPLPATGPGAVGAVSSKESVLIKPTTSDNNTQDSPFAISNAGPGCLTGPKGLAVEGSQGFALDIKFTRGRMQHPDNTLDTVQTLGLLDERMRDVALVALSFNRAHAAWLDQRYGLYLDPRRRRRDDWFVSLNDLGIEYDGGSIGAAMAVRMATYFTRKHVPQYVYVTGEPTISGRVMGVASYGDKIAAPLNSWPSTRRRTPHFLVPTHSVEDGVLVEEEWKALGKTIEGRPIGAPSCSQVRWLKEHSRLGRVLGVKDLFEAIELCLGPPTTGPAVPRPEGPLPGLVVTRTLMSSPNLEYPCRLQEVECFVYPGSGQVVVTGASAGWKKAAEAGIMYVKIQWKQILRRNYMARERYLLSPHDRSYDVHVNVPGGTLVSPSGYVSLAAATAYLSCLFGLQLPPTFALCGEVDSCGELEARPVHRTTLQAAREAGVTIILVGQTQAKEQKADGDDDKEEKEEEEEDEGEEEEAPRHVNVDPSVRDEDCVGIEFDRLDQGHEIVDRLFTDGTTDAHRLAATASAIA